MCAAFCQRLQAGSSSKEVEVRKVSRTRSPLGRPEPKLLPERFRRHDLSPQESPRYGPTFFPLTNLMIV